MDPMTFATYDDYIARYECEDTRERVDSVLGDASVAMLSAYEAQMGQGYTQGALACFDRSAVAVCCAIAHRSLSVPAYGAGASQYSQTAGPYTGSVTFSNPTGDIYISKTEMKRLGLSGQSIGAIMPIGIGDQPC